ncbi:RAD9A [Scenedesmus sp. PABB004]|nr:RAD9A [Scenedesmus sp. PABB004]
MASLSFVLVGVQIKRFRTALKALAAIGSELLVEGIPERLVLRSINSARSAFLAVTLSCQFFESYSLFGATGLVQAGVLIKHLLAAFRSTRVSSMVFELCPEQALLRVTLKCENGLLKRYGLDVSSSDILQANLDGQLLPVCVVAEAAELNKLLNTFQSTLDEVTIIAQPDQQHQPHDGTAAAAAAAQRAVQIQSFYDPAKGAGGRSLHTIVQLDCRSVFKRYAHSGAATSDVTINLKDLRALLGLCVDVGADVALRFDAPGVPLLATPHMRGAQEVDFTAELILATLQESQIADDDGWDAPPAPGAGAGVGARAAAVAAAPAGGAETIHPTTTWAGGGGGGRGGHTGGATPQGGRGGGAAARLPPAAPGGPSAMDSGGFGGGGGWSGAAGASGGRSRGSGGGLGRLQALEAQEAADQAARAPPYGRPASSMARSGSPMGGADSRAQPGQAQCGGGGGGGGGGAAPPPGDSQVDDPEALPGLRHDVRAAYYRQAAAHGLQAAPLQRLSPPPPQQQYPPPGAAAPWQAAAPPPPQPEQAMAAMQLEQQQVGQQLQQQHYEQQAPYQELFIPEACEPGGEGVGGMEASDDELPATPPDGDDAGGGGYGEL